MGLCIQRVAHHEVRTFFCNPRDQRLKNRPVDQSTRSRNAALPRRAKIAGNQPVCGTVQIGVIKHENWRFPTEFERGDRKILGRVSHDMTGGIGASGKGDAVYIRMAGQWNGAIRGIACNDRNHAGRKSGLLNQTREFQHRCRRNFRGFQNHGTPRGQCGAKLCRSQKHLGVPRHNRHHNTNRFTAGKNVHIGLVDGQNCPFNLVRKSCIVAVVLPDIACLACRFRKEFAAVSCLDPAQVIRIFCDQFP